MPSCWFFINLMIFNPAHWLHLIQPSPWSIKSSCRCWNILQNHVSLGSWEKTFTNRFSTDEAHFLLGQWWILKRSLSFHIYYVYQILVQQYDYMNKGSYLALFECFCLEAKIYNSKITLFCQTFEAAESKVPLFFLFFGLQVEILTIFWKVFPFDWNHLEVKSLFPYGRAFSAPPLNKNNLYP